MATNVVEVKMTEVCIFLPLLISLSFLSAHKCTHTHTHGVYHYFLNYGELFIVQYFIFMGHLVWLRFLYIGFLSIFYKAIGISFFIVITHSYYMYLLDMIGNRPVSVWVYAVPVYDWGGIWHLAVPELYSNCLPMSTDGTQWIRGWLVHVYDVFLYII